jgi:hypothetical protein
MNSFKKQIMEWALSQVKNEGRKKVDLTYRGESLLSTGRDEVKHSDPLGNCEQLRFTIINVDNGTLVRMETYRPQDEYVPHPSSRRGPPTFIVKDGEAVQDVVVRLLGIAALERS